MIQRRAYQREIMMIPADCANHGAGFLVAGQLAPGYRRTVMARTPEMDLFLWIRPCLNHEMYCAVFVFPRNDTLVVLEFA